MAAPKEFTPNPESQVDELVPHRLLDDVVEIDTECMLEVQLVEELEESGQAEKWPELALMVAVPEVPNEGTLAPEIDAQTEVDQPMQEHVIPEEQAKYMLEFIRGLWSKEAEESYKVMLNGGSGEAIAPAQAELKALMVKFAPMMPTGRDINPETGASTAILTSLQFQVMRPVAGHKLSPGQHPVSLAEAKSHLQKRLDSLKKDYATEFVQAFMNLVTAAFENNFYEQSK